MKRNFLLLLSLSFLLSGCVKINFVGSLKTSTTENTEASETEKGCSDYANQEKDFAKKLDDNVITEGVKMKRADYNKIYEDTYRECVIFSASLKKSKPIITYPTN